MPRSLSLYYFHGTANQFPQYSDAELKRDLCKDLDAECRQRIETELARRAAARADRRIRNRHFR